MSSLFCFRSLFHLIFGRGDYRFYDSLSRLIEADYNNGANVYNYGYDVAGNMINYDSVTRTYNAANQMTNDGTNTLTYDNNGNLTSNGSDTYAWDRANRLSSVGNHSYVYDGLSNRVQQTVSSIVTDYLNDVQPGLTKLLKQDTGANVERFVHGVRGIHAVDDGTDWNFYAQDGLGSVRAVVDDMAVVQTSMSYDPYGNPFASYGEGFGFTGEQTDADGLLYLRARYYEPSLGVFSALDPFEGVQNRPMSLNGYSWVEGSPIMFTDPSGECVFGLDTVACAYVAGAALITAFALLGTYTATQPSRNQFNPSLPNVNLGDAFSNFTDMCVSNFQSVMDAVFSSGRQGDEVIDFPNVTQAPVVAPPRGTAVATATAPPFVASTPQPSGNPNATPTAQPTLILPPNNPQVTVTTTGTPEQERPIVMDLGPGNNPQEVENILLARPNNKIVAVDTNTLLLETMLRARYSRDRLEIINGDFSMPHILNGRKAVEMFSIYPDDQAERKIQRTVNNHLDVGGHFYTVSESSSRLNRIGNSLYSTMRFGYVHLTGVPTRDIQAGNNGPRIPFSSPTYQTNTAYDLWGFKI